MFATASGLQTFALGTTFWATRTVVLDAWIPANRVATSGDLIKASTLSGAVSGGIIGAVTRGRANVLPGMIMISSFGFLGQVIYNKISAPREKPHVPGDGFWMRMGRKSWFPARVMTDQEYADLLKEKMLKLDVEISIIDDRIAALRKQQALEAEKASSTSDQGTG